MEYIFNSIKSFLKQNVNELLPDYEDENITLPQFSDKFIVFGTFDPSRYENKLVTSVMIDSQDATDGDVTADGYDTNVTITLLISGDTHEKLITKMCRYTAAIKNALRKTHTLNRTVYDAELISVKPYYDAGTVDKQATAVEISLTVSTRE